MAKQLRIIFFGTPLFATGILKHLVDNSYKVVAVVTAPDKPSGRGKKTGISDVKAYAISKSIPVLQPENLQSNVFIDKLKSFKPDLFVVVAFRILPEAVWSLPPKRTFNLHASLLPDYRGAAPINRVIMNGETTTGITTFFLDKKVDTGNIIYREKVDIGSQEIAGELHDKLMKKGALLVQKTIDDIENKSIQPVSQKSLIHSEDKLNKAPKIFKEDCRINWNKTAQEIYNHIRGLSPYPGAFSYLISPEKKKHLIKIYRASFEMVDHNLSPGNIIASTDEKFGVAAKEGIIYPTELQLSSKKRLKTETFLKGFRIDSKWIFE